MDAGTGWPTVFLKIGEEIEPTGDNVRPRRSLRHLRQHPQFGSTSVHGMLHVCLVSDAVSEGSPSEGDDLSKILVPGVIMSCSSSDSHFSTWLELARYARALFAAQATRRFVLAFTFCGSTMRLWEFDRVGGLASCPFDVNKNDLLFVSVVLGYLWMNSEQLGFDPTITESNGRQYLEITRSRMEERLVLVEVLQRHTSIVGRGSTVWKAYREGDELEKVLVVKDSWQHPERGQEGSLLSEATERGVVNVTRHYHHETVRVHGKDDDVVNNVRSGLDTTKAIKVFHPDLKTSELGETISPANASGALNGSMRKTAAQKRSSASSDEYIPVISSRLGLKSLQEEGVNRTTLNRVHRRVILGDYGKSLTKASSLTAFLAALEGNINGHKSLLDLTDIIHSDITLGNLLMNEEERNPSWSAFLIDLDVSRKKTQKPPIGAPITTLTRAFMAVGALQGDRHTFMHDLESFFWVLFWVCVHYTGPEGASRVIPEFESWHLERPTMLAKIKSGMVEHEEGFLKKAHESFTPYFIPLVPWVNELRKVVFPNGQRWRRAERKLHERITGVLQRARKDPRLLAR